MRKLTAVLAVGALALGVSACGKKNSGDPVATAQEALVYRSSWGADEPQGKIIQSLFDDFAKQTGAKVDLSFVGRKGNENLATEMAAGQGPDLYDVATDNIATYGAQNLVAPLDDVLPAQVPGEGKTVRDLLPESVRQASSDGKGLAFIPHTVISTAVWYDAAKHPDLNPQSWDDFIAYLDQAKKEGRTPIGQDGTINFYNVYWFYSVLVRANGAGSLKALTGDAAAWDKPEVLEAAKKVEQLAKGGYFQKDFMATKFPAAQDGWAQGKYDLNINGTWLASETKPKLAAGVKVAAFQLPAGGKNSVEAGTLGWAVNAKGKNVATAKKFLAFALQKKYVERFATEALSIPARADVPAPEHLVAVQKAVAEAAATHKTYDDAAADKAWWNDLFLPLHDLLISGKIDAATFVKDGKKKTADYLANKN
ncbi:extracellular solute-binding protein [Nonomuraea sp. NBC_01738]|uniref:ABC transporter substrate-binding protein n=1 Tax=Nonomuraea sp. NBC_01738 TaxID=2976003 RepID=UPI002E0EEF39|nr:extracellular solute-binding protein [Nonomuraea sp. NBC_01738]